MIGWVYHGLPSYFSLEEWPAIDQQSTRPAVQAAVQQGREPAVVSATAAKASPGNKGAAETLSFAVIHDRSWQSTS